MALFKRPNADYKPDKILPNNDAFQRLASQNKPLPSRLLDATINYMIDVLNRLSAALDQAQAGVFPGSDDPENKNKIIYSDGLTGKWGKLIGMFMEPQTVTAREIKDKEVKRDKIDLLAVGEAQLDDLVVSPKKLQPFPLSKVTASGKKCLIMGIAGSNAYTEKVADNNSQSWYVFCNDPSITSISLNSLATIWNYTPYTFTGIKLTDQTVSLTKLVTEATGGFLISGAANTAIEILPVLDTDYWKLPVRTSSSKGKVVLQRLDDICANYADSIDASCLRQNTVTLDKLAQDVLTAIRDNDFATATVSINGTLLRKKNVSSVRHLGTGKYRVNFTSQPPSGSINYNVQLSIGGTYSCSWANKTLNSIDVNIFTVTQYYDAPFDIVVSDAGA